MSILDDMNEIKSMTDDISINNVLNDMFKGFADIYQPDVWDKDNNQEREFWEDMNDEQK